jgi:hypothetical protein
VAIVLIPTHENIQVIGIAGFCVDVNGMSAHNQKPNSTGMEHGQEIELVWEKLH